MEEPLKVTFSIHHSEKVRYDYTYMSNLFSAVTAISIENYIILHKIERVKELPGYDQLTLSEISYTLNYSSVADLSKQFKNFTGLTPSYFTNLQQIRLENKENV